MTSPQPPQDPFAASGQPPLWGPPPGPGAPGWSAPAPAASDWGTQPYAGGGTSGTDTSAVVALVLAVSSFVLFPLVPAVAALFVARSARRSIAASGGRLGGSGLVTAAKVVAWINIVLCVLGALAVAALVGFAFSAGDGAFTGT